MTRHHRPSFRIAHCRIIHAAVGQKLAIVAAFPKVTVHSVNDGVGRVRQYLQPLLTTPDHPHLVAQSVTCHVPFLKSCETPPSSREEIGAPPLLTTPNRPPLMARSVISVARTPLLEDIRTGQEKQLVVQFSGWHEPSGHFSHVEGP